MHESLLAIPITESAGGAEDENDLHFLEEGRRMLAVGRFHVVRPAKDADTNRDEASWRAARYDRLFSTCWSELMEHTGSLILFPDSELTDLRRFADMNLIRPLEWLGVRNDFEIVSMERGSPAIRLIYRLQDMPDVPDDPNAYASTKK
jgi:hypothetical protein